MSGPGAVISNSDISRAARCRRARRSSTPRRATAWGSDMTRFSATVMPSTQPESWRSSGITPTPAAAIAPGSSGRHGRAGDLDRALVELRRATTARRPAPAARCPPPRPRRRSRRRRTDDVERDQLGCAVARPAPTRPGCAAQGPARRRPATSPRPSLRAPVDRWGEAERRGLRPQRDLPSDHRPRQLRASASAAGSCSTTRPWRMIVITSVAWRISSSLWLTSATVRPSSATTRRSTENSCSLSAGVSTRGRLVEDEDRRVAAQALDDLDPLALPGRQDPDAGVGVDVEPVVLADLADPGPRRGGSSRAGSPSTTFSQTVRASTRRVVLVHHGDAEVGGDERVVDVDRLAADDDPPSSGSTSPIRIFIRVDLPAPFSPRMPWISPWRSVEVHGVAGHHRAVALGDALQLDDRGGRSARSRPPRQVTRRRLRSRRPSS